MLILSLVILAIQKAQAVFVPMMTAYTTRGEEVDIEIVEIVIGEGVIRHITIKTLKKTEEEANPGKEAKNGGILEIKMLDEVFHEIVTNLVVRKSDLKTEEGRTLQVLNARSLSMTIEMKF